MLAGIVPRRASGDGRRRFDLPPSAVSSKPPARAELRLLCTSADKGKRAVHLHALDSAAAWDERTVTAATAPRWAGAPVAVAETAGPGWVSFDVTAYVAQRARDAPLDERVLQFQAEYIAACVAPSCLLCAPL